MDLVGCIAFIEAFQKLTVWAGKNQGMARYLGVGEI